MRAASPIPSPPEGGRASARGSAERARAVRVLACAGGLVFCYLAFLLGADASDAYVTRYGTFVLSRGELALKLYLVLFMFPAAVLLALLIAELVPSSRILGAFDALARRPRGRLWPLVLAVAVLGLVIGVRAGVLREAAITDDEHVYHFQAQLLASGRLYAASLPEPVRPFFQNQFIINNGRWFGTYFLGHPAVLAVAARLGVLSWIGAIEAALTLLLAIVIARRLFNDRVAIITGILLVLSPFFIFISATHLSQPTSTVFLTLFLLAVLQIEARPRSVGWWSLAAGALVAGAFTRPQTAVFLSVPFLGRLGYLWIRGVLRPDWGPVSASLGVLAIGAAAFLGVNHVYTGSVFRTAYHLYWDLGLERSSFPRGLLPAVRDISQNVAQLNFWLLGWPLSLAFVPFFQRDGRAWPLAAVPVLGLVWYGAAGIPTVAAVGPVYFGEAIVPLVILTASGIERAVTFVRHRLGDTLPTRALVAAPIAGILVSLFAFVPTEIASVRLMADVSRLPYDLVEARGLDRATVFVRNVATPFLAPGSWAYYHRNNSPDLGDPVLFVRDLGPEKNKELMRYLPDRAPYWMGMVNGKFMLLPLER